MAKKWQFSLRCQATPALSQEQYDSFFQWLGQGDSAKGQKHYRRLSMQRKGNARANYRHQHDPDFW